MWNNILQSDTEALYDKLIGAGCTNERILVKDFTIPIQDFIQICNDMGFILKLRESNNVKTE